MYDPTSAETALSLYRADRSTSRFLQSLADTGSVDHIQVFLSHHQGMLERFRDDIPGIPELLGAHTAYLEYARTHPNEMMDYIAAGKVTPEIRVLLRRLREGHSRVAAWGKSFLMTLEHLRNDGVISRAVAKPKVTGRHYVVAQAAAKAFAEHWFIKRVVLFGSVARGEEGPQSDVDLFVEPMLRSSRALRIMNDHLLSFVARTGMTVNAVLGRPATAGYRRIFLAEVGAFDESIPLYERTGWSFRCDRKVFRYRLDRYLGATVGNPYSVLLFRHGKGKAQAVVVDERDRACLGVFSGIRQCRHWLPEPQWEDTGCYPDSNIVQSALKAVYRFRQRGLLVEMDPWLARPA